MKSRRPAGLAVIVVNYRRADLTLACLESVARSTLRDQRLIIVENGSGDDSAARIAAAHPDADVLVSAVNRGFAGGCNLGIRRALEGGDPLLLLLNNDTVVDPGALEALATTMRDNPRAGIVGAKILFADRPGTVWFAGGEVDPRSGDARHRGEGMADLGQFDRPGPCDFVTGCCLLARAETCRGIGLLDERFFAYYEDADYSLRARRAGWQVIYQPAARVYHHVSTTTGWDSPFYLYFTLRNRLLFVRRHAPFPRWLPGLPRLAWFYARQLGRQALWLRNRAGLRAAWWGMVDGLAGWSGYRGEGRFWSLEGPPAPRATER